MAILITYRRKLASGCHRTLTVEVPATPTEWDDVKDRSLAWALSQGRGAIKVLGNIGLAAEAAELQEDAREELSTEWAKTAVATARQVAQAILCEKGARTSDRARHATAAVRGGGKLVR